MSYDNYVLTILHVNILSTIDLFSVLLTSFFKQGNTAFRFDSIIVNNREEKKSLRPFARFYFQISPSREGRGKKASSNLNN